MSEIYSDVRDNDLFSYIPTSEGPARRVIISTGGAVNVSKCQYLNSRTE